MDNKVLYHATDMKNLASILEDGIRPSPFDGVVYLADSAENAVRFVMLRGYREIAVLPCNVSGFETRDHSEAFFKYKSYGYVGTIVSQLIDWDKALKFKNPFAIDKSKLEDIGI